MELHTNRAAKHRYGKQRCKTSDMTFSYEKMNLQIRSMFDTEPTSAELITKSLILSFLVIIETDKLQHGTRETNAQRNPSPLKHNCNRKKAVTIQPSKAGCQNSQKGDSTSQKKQPSPSSTKKKHTQKRPTNIAQADPAYTHNTMSAFDISVDTSHDH